MTTDNTAFAGFHRFRTATGEGFGSFEVWYNGEGDAQRTVDEIGWYWWACFPGCMPDGEASGPFPTAEGAYLAANLG